MTTRQIVRLTVPIMLLSLVPLAIALGTAWLGYQSQKKASEDLARSVTSMRAGEELAIGIRDVRTQLDHYLTTRDRKHLEEIPALRAEMDRWLNAAERAASRPREQELIARVKRGYERFFGELAFLTHDPLPPDVSARLRAFIDEVTHEVLLPAQEYLDAMEEEITRSNEANVRMVNRMALTLTLLGVCGPIAGLLAGYGIARTISRSIVRLSMPIRDAAGKLNKIVGPLSFSAAASLDELEMTLKGMANQIGAVVDRLQKSQRETLRAEQLAAVGQMAAGMAHELRNPLTAIKILVQSASDSERRGELRGRDLIVLDEEIGRLEQSLQIFLDFARPQQLERGAFDVRGLIAQTVALISSRANQQGVEVREDLPDQPVQIEADAVQLRQVLLNLLLNALDAVPRGGSVSVAARAFATEIAVEIADTGPGVPGELGDRIFQPFVSTKETGTGLGLSICKRIVEAHGGEIAVANRPTGGAIFTVRLPSR